LDVGARPDLTPNLTHEEEAMHYFTFGNDLAAVEDGKQAEKYAAAGWEKVSRAAFIVAWRARDARALQELCENVETGDAPLVRAAGEPWRAEWRLMPVDGRP